MLNQSILQKNIIKGILWALSAGAALLFTLLMLQASSLSTVSEQATRYVSIAGVQLIQLSKDMIDGGYAASFTFLPALAWYLAIFLGIGVIIGWLRSHITDKRKVL